MEIELEFDAVAGARAIGDLFLREWGIPVPEEEA